jgi:hypothetical protein
MLDSLGIILCKVDDPCAGLLETVAACSFKEGRPRCEENAMDGVPFCSTDNGQI